MTRLTFSEMACFAQKSGYILAKTGNNYKLLVEGSENVFILKNSLKEVLFVIVNGELLTELSCCYSELPKIEKIVRKTAKISIFLSQKEHMNFNTLAKRLRLSKTALVEKLAMRIINKKAIDTSFYHSEYVKHKNYTIFVSVIPDLKEKVLAIAENKHVSLSKLFREELRNYCEKLNIF